MRKTLTFQYTFHQMAYWATAAGVMSFATAFLLQKGFAASTVGILLASGNLLSCAFQPVLAAWADRTGGNVLKWMTAALTAVSAACFASLQLLAMRESVFGFLYLLGIFAFDAMNPLMNALNVSYMTNGYSINYGLSRGLGSLAYAFAALGIGKVMAKFGADWMIWISLGLLEDAEGVARHPVFHICNEDGPVGIFQQDLQVSVVVFLCTAAEQIRTDLVMYLSNLLQQVDHTGNIFGFSKTDGHGKLPLFDKFQIYRIL